VVHAVDVSKHPEVNDLGTISLEESATSPSNLVSRCINLETATSVHTSKCHSGGGSILRDDQIIDDTCEIR